MCEKYMGKHLFCQINEKFDNPIKVSSIVEAYRTDEYKMLDVSISP